MDPTTPAPHQRRRHEDRRADGRYRATPPCDGCGRPVGADFVTDGEDDPGFYLCDRARCVARLAPLPVEERRAIYEATRARRAGGSR